MLGFPVTATGTRATLFMATVLLLLLTLWLGSALAQSKFGRILTAVIADRVTVLHQGQVLAEGSLREVQANEQVIEVYLGR